MLPRAVPPIGVSHSLDRGGAEPIELAFENALLAGRAAAVEQREKHFGCLSAFLVDGFYDRGDGRGGEVGPVFAVESQKTDLLWKQMGHGLKCLVDTGECPLILYEDKCAPGGVELVLKVLGEFIDRRFVVVDGNGFVDLSAGSQRLGIPLKTLHAGAHFGHVGGDGEKVLVAGIEKRLRGIVYAVIEVGLDPAGARAVDGRVKKDNRLTGTRDAVVDGLEVGRGLDDKAINAEREHFVDIHELGLGVEIAGANDRLVARGEHDLFHAVEDEARPFVGVIQDDDGDDVGVLAGECLRLGVGDISQLFYNVRDLCLCFVAELVSFVVEVIRDAGC